MSGTPFLVPQPGWRGWDDVRDTAWLPAEYIQDVAQSSRSLLRRILLISLTLILTPIIHPIFMLLMFTHWAAHQVRPWLKPNSPPLMPPGRRFKDLELGLARRFQQKPPAHEHRGIEFPRELIDLVFDHFHPVNDEWTFLICALVCPCWLSASRARTFHTVRAHLRRAYRLHELIGSPYCTFIPHIRRVILIDSSGWTVSGTLLSQMISSGVTPKSIELALTTRLFVPPPSAFSQVTELKLELDDMGGSKTRLLEFATFLAAFTVLESLHIHTRVTGVSEGLEKAHKSYSPDRIPYTPKHQLSTRLTMLVILRDVWGYKWRNKDFSPVYNDMDLAYLILRHKPRLEILRIRSVVNGYEQFPCLSEYFKTQMVHLKHLEIAPPMRGLDEHSTLDGDALNRIIPLSDEGGSCQFPELVSIHLCHYSFTILPSRGSIDEWIIKLARSSNRLADITIKPLLLSGRAIEVLMDELGFVRDDIENGEGYYRFFS